MAEERPSRRRLLTVGGTALAGLVAGCNSDTATDTPAETATSTATETPTPEPVDVSGQVGSQYADVYEEVAPSVVQITAGASQGSGFVYDTNHVVTNAHVVGGERTAEVRFATGRWESGEVVGRDANADLAVVRVPSRPESARQLSVAEGEATVGREVVVIGSPFGLGGSITSGIVSGVDRSIPAPSGFTIPDAVQTDAAVNPGNSGGPMVALDGTVVAVINSGKGNDIAFGISGALTNRVVPALIETGNYDHPFAGVGLRAVTPDIAQANELETAEGLLVVTVGAGAPADGVLLGSDSRAIVDGQRYPVGGDVLLAIDGQRLTTPQEFAVYLALETSPGDTVTLRVRRDGEVGTLDLELGVQPS